MTDKTDPGPLVVYPSRCWEGHYVIKEDEAGSTGGFYIVGNFGPHGPHLFAAAPDMRDALEAALIYVENTEGALGIQLPSGKKARAALAKAKGEGA